MLTVLKRRALRDKIIVAFFIPTLLITLLGGALTYMTARQGLEQELGLRLVAIGQTLAADFSRGIEAGQLARMDESKVRTRERLRQRLLAIQSDTGARRLFLFDTQRRSLVDTDPEVEFHQRLFTLDADSFELERAVQLNQPTLSVLFTAADGTPYKTAYIPVTLAPQHESEPARVVATLGVEASASFFDLLNDFARGLVGLGVLSAALVVLVGVLVARGVTRPVNELVEAARRLEQGELEAAVVAPEDMARMREGDELDSLRVSFEEMRRAVLGRDRQMQMMLSGIAHEVRNPLGGMELFCGLLREDLEWDEPVDHDKIEKVERIQREVVYLNKVVTDFLDFAKHRPLEHERFGAREMLDEIANLLRQDALEHGCELEVQAEQGVELTGDRERLRRAIINTARNAWQASPQGGTITLGALERGPQRVLSITDQGSGIPEQTLQEILTPFFTTREKGSGLGLALTQKIVEQHGGQLQMESTVGQGTCVRFVLPFDPHTPEHAQAQAAIPEGWLG